MTIETKLKVVELAALFVRHKDDLPSKMTRESLLDDICAVHRHTGLFYREQVSRNQIGAIIDRQFCAMLGINH